jgi:hypothetical protein
MLCTTEARNYMCQLFAAGVEDLISEGRQDMKSIAPYAWLLTSRVPELNRPCLASIGGQQRFETKVCKPLISPSETEQAKSRITSKADWQHSSATTCHVLPVLRSML